MRKTTNPKKLAPVLCTLAVILIAAVYLAIVLFAMLTESATPAIVVLVMALYCLIILAVMVGVVFALMQRLREIDHGEEEDASKY